MSSFDPIDSWFEKGFRIRKQKAAKTAQGAQRDNARSSGGGSFHARRGGVSFSSAAKTKNIKSVIKKAPEVMVKITGSSSGMATVKHHLDYISRNGEVELVNELGETINGQAELRELRAQLKASQIPEEGTKREFLHVLFSMPPGTPEKELRASVAEFCREEFSNRQYVMAFHGDTDHVHMHVNVSTRDIDRADEPRLSPRKEDLFRWRQGFADKLRENGVEAAASDRKVRFNYRRPEHAVIRQIRADNPNSTVFNKARADKKTLDRVINATIKPHYAFMGAPRPPRTPKVYEAVSTYLQAALKANIRPVNPAEQNIETSRKALLSTWSKVAANLDNEGNTDLAKQVRDLMRSGQEKPSSCDQELYDLASNAQSQKIEKNFELEL